MTRSGTTSRTPTSTELINAGFIAAMAAVAVWAAWPIYQTGYLLVTAIGAFLASALIAWFGRLRSSSWTTVALITLGAYLVLGVPLALPAALGSVPAALSGVLDVVVATVFSWKQLVTISIPVGTYQSMLVPMFLLLLVCSTVALSLTWRASRRGALAVPVMFVAQLFGLLFGSGEESTPTSGPGFLVAGPREAAIGLAALIVAVGYLVWRVKQERSAAIRVTASASGVRRRRRTAGAANRVRQALLGAGILLIAVSVAVTTVSTFARPAEREVLRTAISPDVDLNDFVSPLTQYRGFFSADAYEAELFRVTNASPEVTRIRLAVLSHYDGQVFRTVDPARGDSARQTAFQRVPSVLDAAGNPVSLDIELGDYGQVWLPTAGNLTSISFTGDNEQSLADGFFYNRDFASGVELNGTTSGDGYSLTAALPPDSTALADLEKPSTSAGLVDESHIPESLREWVQAQEVSSDGAGLEVLITRLRERGYLSHSIATPPGDSGWLAALGGAPFEPSLAGHSMERVGTLFTTMLDKQNLVGTTGGSLVSAVGDDEQFAVAAALLAQNLGFPSRVVLGFVLAGESTGIPACTDGVCAGKNLTAWVEVAGADGTWVRADVTPQHEVPLAVLEEERSDPQNDTEVTQSSAIEQLPPDADPSSGDDEPATEEPPADALGWLWPLLRGVGIGLLIAIVVATPFITILLAKAKRRFDRRRAVEPTTRIAGGWDEYLDSAVDHGLPAPEILTRSELADAFATARGSRDGSGVLLAELADAAVFGPIPPNEQGSDAFWQLVDSERALLGEGSSPWARARAALSLRSFSRYLGDGRRGKKRYSQMTYRQGTRGVSQ
ncbi:transglutaminase superfamily protein [Glaciihabitans tibetensis]|uniref:Transglutaminase superfamily protein n=1 Tax=Glaciihabitans tibetensis TaxID=1266600 RepID=A0A2T0VD73_9MICO|nr:transglutaminase domain-containing protein [Glaciihabitans tibetensis]PRY68106.1 transglutaminase superfamily protein [Glaciihabitans tibetensis]